MHSIAISRSGNEAAAQVDYHIIFLTSNRTIIRGLKTVSFMTIISNTVLKY